MLQKDKIELEKMQTGAADETWATGGRAQKSKRSMKLWMTLRNKIRNITSPFPAGQENGVQKNIVVLRA